MRENPERLAWVVLLLSFFACVGLAGSVPLGARWYVMNARIDRSAVLDVQQPPLSVTLGGRGLPVSVTEDRDDIQGRTRIDTSATSGRLVVRSSEVDDIALVTVQIYQNTQVVFTLARSPRFAVSRLPHEVILDVGAGRVRVNVADSKDRPTVVTVHTPYGATTFAKGSYEVKVNGRTMEVIVRDGQAEVISGAKLVLPLDLAERAIIQEGHVTGPLPAARNIIRNGDFRAPLDQGWTSYSEQTDPQQPSASVQIVANEGREVVNLYRSGSNHAEVGIRQEINYDVRDFSFVGLHLVFRISHQDISGFGGCGYLGSECPISVRVDYKDVYGTDREWLHSFYTGEPASDWLVNWWAEQVQEDSWQTFDSGNLMEELADTPPALIRSLTIYASGHSFDAMVTEVELLAQE